MTLNVCVTVSPCAVVSAWPVVFATVSEKLCEDVSSELVTCVFVFVVSVVVSELVVASVETENGPQPMEAPTESE